MSRDNYPNLATDDFVCLVCCEGKNIGARWLDLDNEPFTICDDCVYDAYNLVANYTGVRVE